MRLSLFEVLLSLLTECLVGTELRGRRSLHGGKDGAKHLQKKVKETSFDALFESPSNDDPDWMHGTIVLPVEHPKEPKESKAYLSGKSMETSTKQPKSKHWNDSYSHKHSKMGAKVKQPVPTNPAPLVDYIYVDAQTREVSNDEHRNLQESKSKQVVGHPKQSPTPCKSPADCANVGFSDTTPCCVYPDWICSSGESAMITPACVA